MVTSRSGGRQFKSRQIKVLSVKIWEHQSEDYKGGREGICNKNVANCYPLALLLKLSELSEEGTRLKGLFKRLRDV